jgi:hypothetical protein
MSTNTLTIVPISSEAEMLTVGADYVLKVHSIAVWLDGDVRLVCNITKLPIPVPSSREAPPAIDYESEEFQDELKEILDDTATEGDGRWRPDHLIHHLKKHGYKLIRTNKEE